MAIVKLTNRAVKDATAVGSTTQLGNLVFISKQTASSSASVSFTSGIDSTYKEYIFYFNNIHPQNASTHLTFQGSTDGGSNYNTTLTSTLFRAYHLENDTGAALNYITSSDLAQSTSYQPIIQTTTITNTDDDNMSGYLHLFEPSSTTFVKHFISNCNATNDGGWNSYLAGYFNTTSAINAIDFKFASGNIDAGTISLFGVV
jgi:hypothetical protein